VSANDELNANPAIREARDRVQPAGLKFQVTAQFCEETGGPQTYIGRSMEDSHEHLNITEGQWQIMLDEFKVTLDKFEVPEKEQQELFVIVESTKADIVIAKD
jgi:hemoglobin